MTVTGPGSVRLVSGRRIVVIAAIAGTILSIVAGLTSRTLWLALGGAQPLPARLYGAAVWPDHTRRPPALGLPDQNGQVDGVFDPRNCDVLGVLESLVGTDTGCGTFTETDATVIREIWQGPRKSSQSQLLHGQPVWFGLEPGADLAGIAARRPPGQTFLEALRAHCRALAAAQLIAEWLPQVADSPDDRDARTATFTVRAPETAGANTIEEALAAGASWWPLQMARELDDAILSLRTNDLDLGLWILKTAGNPEAVLAIDEFLAANQNHWFVREVVGMMRRTLARLDVTSRSMFAVIEPGSCFVGTLMELALAADRSYMLDTEETDAKAAVWLSKMNFGPLPMVSGLSRLAARFYNDETAIEALRGKIGTAIAPREAAESGIVTAAPDDLDWTDELRLAIESRASLSPDALTGLEANLRFGLPESMETRVFGRLSAWQNWIFNRPNAIGESGALKVYGTGAPVKFNWERV